MKLETWLRIAGIPCETAPLDLAAAPRGKVPYIEEAGVGIGDTTRSRSSISRPVASARSSSPRQGRSRAR
ncbi:hypothetical protein WME89_02300 [Sorangium sp. So ce321]|uniref:hypothetical protein n=1 Tax=Sorangium sp. So ce321 TaxID=3133300 RepID=UPI003F633F17